MNLDNRPHIEDRQHILRPFERRPLLERIGPKIVCWIWFISKREKQSKVVCKVMCMLLFFVIIPFFKKERERGSHLLHFTSLQGLYRLEFHQIRSIERFERSIWEDNWPLRRLFGWGRVTSAVDMSLLEIGCSNLESNNQEDKDHNYDNDNLCWKERSCYSRNRPDLKTESLVYI